MDKKRVFLNGMKMGIPIGLGYFAVSFSLGISAKNAGLNVLQAALASLMLNASAGEYALFTLIAAGASFFEVALMELVANARYLLMSCALSQKLSSEA
ncbi:MAG: AzlC family ABC transporter permease, partial [Clostridia bacterium]|nr:AzlC family ABC transporter permease [Clostridia bacterium]